MWNKIDGFIPEPEVWDSGWAKNLGISLKEVTLSDEGNLQFNPTFFHPLEANYQEKYPIDKRHPRYDPRDLHLPFPVWEDILEQSTKCAYEYLSQGLPAFITWQYSDEENVRYPTRKVIQEAILAQAKCVYEFHLQHSSPWVSVCSPDHPFSLRGFTLKGDWAMSEILVVKKESIESSPHAIISIAVQVQATAMDPEPTVYEIRAILRFLMSLWPRWNPRAQRVSDVLVHPILLIAYVGRNHGRIMQAFYDGHGLNLQYSPLMSFEDEEDVAPVDLFFRYMLSNPIQECVKPRDLNSNSREDGGLH
ncbi:hypothetical protein N7528_007992 [Penicillium herquei]|nr:hypothetical protein N7528_007992 [Penicillium herquei]